jgi:hypothetical protein
MADIAAIRSDSRAGTCPHCGSAITYPVIRGDARNEPFGA